MFYYINLLVALTLPAVGLSGRQVVYSGFIEGVDQNNELKGIKKLPFHFTYSHSICCS